MDSGFLKDRIEIYQQVVTRTDSGATDIEYEFKCSTRARVNWSTGDRTVNNDEIFYSTDREFIVRAYVPVVETDEIRWNNQRWQILSIEHNKRFNNIFIKTTLINE